MLKFDVVTEIKECERLWNIFSPDEYLFDSWEYRASFYDPIHHSLYFIVGREEEEIVGILPLWKAKNVSYHEWFGGEFPERNRFMIKDKRRIPEFISQLPEDVWLPYFEKGSLKYLPSHTEETRFFLELKKYNDSLDGYLATFSGKHRKNLKRDLSALTSLNYSVIRNSMQDFQRMIELNARRFEKKSFFSEKDFTDGFRRLIEIAHKRDELEMLSITIAGKTEAAEAAILHKGTYTVLLGGNNLGIANIGKLLTIEHIKNALAKNATIIDFLVDDCGWKKMWNMSEEPLYEYSKDPPTEPAQS